MPVLAPEFKEIISSLSTEEKEKIIFRICKKNKDIYETLLFEYMKDESGRDFFKETKNEIASQFTCFWSRVIQKELARAVTHSIKAINRFASITNDKKQEADLLNFLLKIIFTEFSEELGTCWTTFDSKVGTATRRLLNLVNKKLHEDHHIEYKADINSYIKILKSKCGHLDSVFNMPDSLD